MLLPSPAQANPKLPTLFHLLGMAFAATACCQIESERPCEHRNREETLATVFATVAPSRQPKAHPSLLISGNCKRSETTERTCCCTRRSSQLLATTLGSELLARLYARRSKAGSRSRLMDPLESERGSCPDQFDLIQNLIGSPSNPVRSTDDSISIK